MTTNAGIHVALVGNPNTGKSTLFQALTGVRQHTGNYPGVTVEKKIGVCTWHGRRLTLIDLPGTYSLAPRSPDEMVAVDVILGRRRDTPQPDAVLCIVDAANLPRNLYLVSQVLDMGVPVVVALNMVDLAERQQIRIDSPLLSDRLGVPVIPVQAHRGHGLDALREALCRTAAQTTRTVERVMPEALYREAEGIRQLCPTEEVGDYLSVRLLLDTSGYLQQAIGGKQPDGLAAELEAARTRLQAAGIAIPGIEAQCRYQWIAELTRGVIARPLERPRGWSDRTDRWLTNRWWGTAFFVALMLLMFQAVFSWAEPAMEAIEFGVGAASNRVAMTLPDGPLRSLLVDGVLAGFGGVVVFLPQIVILFLFIAVLEDCGYLARAAYLMDLPMSRIGLSGKSFIPLLSSFACAIPGIMSARVIENRRDRFLTILIAPLMSCSARLPVYTLLIETFVPERTVLGGWLSLQSVTMLGAYLIGVAAAMAVAGLLRRTLFRGERAPFVLELPSYKWPSGKVVLQRVVDRGWAFVRRAGTLIVAVSVLVWAAAYFPRPSEATSAHRSAALHDSYLGRVGRFIEPAVKPLGWDWRIGSAVIASFPAHEVVIGALGVIFQLGDEPDEHSVALRVRLRRVTWEGTDRPVFNLPVALSLIVFYALCAQCAATLVVMRRETASWRWPLLTFCYMTGLAYVAAWGTYQLGMVCRWGW